MEPPISSDIWYENYNHTNVLLLAKHLHTQLLVLPLSSASFGKTTKTIENPAMLVNHTFNCVTYQSEQRAPSGHHQDKFSPQVPHTLSSDPWLL